MDIGADDIKAMLTEIKSNPESLEDVMSEDDKHLRALVGIVKRHMYGSKTSSVSARRKEVLDYLDRAFLGSQSEVD